MLPRVLVRDRKCPIVRKNYKEWRFFYNGYVSGSTSPYTFSVDAFSSIRFPLVGDATSTPLISTYGYT